MTISHLSLGYHTLITITKLPTFCFASLSQANDVLHLQYQPCRWFPALALLLIDRPDVQSSADSEMPFSYRIND